MTKKQLIKEILKTMNDFEKASNEFLLSILTEDELKSILKNRK